MSSGFAYGNPNPPSLHTLHSVKPPALSSFLPAAEAFGRRKNRRCLCLKVTPFPFLWLTKSENLMIPKRVFRGGEKKNIFSSDRSRLSPDPPEAICIPSTTQLVSEETNRNKQDNEILSVNAIKEIKGGDGEHVGRLLLQRWSWKSSLQRWHPRVT